VVRSRLSHHLCLNARARFADSHAADKRGLAAIPGLCVHLRDSHVIPAQARMYDMRDN
jgi:hypothetical protein